MNKIRLGLVIALVLVVWLASSLVRVENQRYAMQVGMCLHEEKVMIWDLECLAKVQTRTSWVWHLFYALTD